MNIEDAPAAIILAAGKSTRMKSDLPKVLHDICGRPMIEYVINAVRDAGVKKITVVVGHKAELVQQQLEADVDITFALQEVQQGTGHAVMMCEAQLAAHNGPVFVLAGDTPLLQGESLVRLLDVQRSQNASCVIGSADTVANFGLGRIVRNPAGDFERIVEQKDATPEEAAITEINTGCYVFDSQSLLGALRQLRPDNAQAEYYLTDCPAILKSEGKPVVAAAELDIDEAMGVNTRAQLAEVAAAVQASIQLDLMLSGVSIIDPAQTYIDIRANVEKETVIHPFSYIGGPSTIGKGCCIGPHAVVSAGAELADGTVVAPFETAK